MSSEMMKASIMKMVGMAYCKQYIITYSLGRCNLQLQCHIYVMLKYFSNVAYIQDLLS